MGSIQNPSKYRITDPALGEYEHHILPLEDIMGHIHDKHCWCSPRLDEHHRTREEQNTGDLTYVHRCVKDERH